MRGLTIGRLAEETGVNLETVRYYERIGLMPRPDRTAGGHRSYSKAHARRLAFIRRARELGFGLGEIRALLVLAEPGRTSCAEVQAIATSIPPEPSVSNHPTATGCWKIRSAITWQRCMSRGWCGP